MTTAYIAGKMTGEPMQGWDLFDAAAERLRDLQWEVFSPADMDRAAGIDPNQDTVPMEVYQQCFRNDLVAISKSDVIVLLENWIYSPGARCEAKCGLFCGHDFYMYIEDEDIIIELDEMDVRRELESPEVPSILTPPAQEEEGPLPMVIGLGHAAQVGKDSVAQILVEEHGFTRVAFADTLKQFVYETNSIVAGLVDKIGWDSAKNKYPDIVRKALVDVGNAARRIIGEDVWVNAVFDNMKPNTNYVISDVRYPNEIERVLEAGGHTVKITRPGFEPRNDVADQALAGYTDWDYTLDNNGSPEELASKVAGTLYFVILDHGEVE